MTGRRTKKRKRSKPELYRQRDVTSAMLSDSEVKAKQPYFGKWLLEERIGIGTFGSVYSIYHIQNGVKLTAAMKVISIPQSASDLEELRGQGFGEQEIKTFYEKQVDAFVNEIRILQRFRGNDHVVCYEDHTVVKHEDRIQWDIYIRMECLEQLDKYFKRTRATRQDVLQLWYDIGLALISCHENNVVHRDIKPANILVSREGYYKLVDFGIARHIEKGLASTTAGTYPYMAPEVQKHKEYDGRADIYSLGIVVYQLFNASRYPFLPPYPQPFTADDRDAAIAQRMSGKTVPSIPGLPLAIMKILWKCLAFDQKHRYPTAEAMVRDLMKLSLESEETAVPLYDNRGELLPVESWVRRKKPTQIALIVFAGLLILYGLMMLIYFFTK